MKTSSAFYFCPVAIYLLYAGANISANAKHRHSSTTKRDIRTDQACAEFHEENPIGSGWVRSDCEAVWSKWASTLDGAEFQPLPIRDIFKEVTTALRQEGNPCLVDSFRYPDGVGSAAIRLLATWMFAEDMGCDWIAPKSPRSSIDDTGTSLYCHPMMLFAGHEPKSLDGAEDPSNGAWRCEVTNWLAFFHFDAHGVKGDRNDTAETIYPSTHSDPERFMRVVEEYKAGRANRRWDHLLFYLGKGGANRFFQMVSSWNSNKREMARNVLQRFRESFYEFPRPWFDENPRCMYSSSPRELNFAIHVRLGDRAAKLNGWTNDYPGYLEDFMAVLTAAVTDRGLDPPRFHVFSETGTPCPSAESGTFPEFPMWPVEEYQIAPCLTSPTPEDCPEKRAGAPACNPERSGIFRVVGEPLYLHVGIDVQNDISCMINADGILMGCSTFGQISGVVNKGIRFFSFGCSGPGTPNHYKMMPPLAIAEKGSMWIPISGSWHDPVIMSKKIFEAALDEHLKNIEVSVR